jgi:hypothetical protein
MQRNAVYIGADVDALAVTMKPLILQVATLPIDHGAAMVPFGIANGPVKIARDCTISAMLSPNMMRR